MTDIESIDELKALVKEWRKRGLSVGLVPTMGFLHDGHISLINEARKSNDRVVVSIFVNPMQFGPNEDFESYPRDIDTDIAICSKSGADAVFIPTVSEMYPEKNDVYVDASQLGLGLCGASRPGHFQGVCTVVCKLLNIVTPDRAYFGEKDAQQLAIIKRMVQDLNMDTEVVGCPIIREEDGLAMSSRNTYLSAKEREAARVLYKALMGAKQLLAGGERDATVIRQYMGDTIASQPLARINYIEIVDPKTLRPIDTIKTSALLALAILIGNTRLIDNYIFREN